MKINETVQIYRGQLSAIFIYEEFITGTVVKVNKKSIRVHMTHAKCTENGKVTHEYDMNKTATFTFWKTIENAGETVDIYKNNLYGIIKIAR